MTGVLDGRRVLASCRGAGVRVGSAWLVRDVDCDLEAGTLTALVGPNGAGKSTLLGLLAGDRAPDAGEVLVAGRPPTGTRARDLARVRSVMRQEHRTAFAFGVDEVVAMGRVPHAADPDLDDAVVAEAIDLADLAGLEHRDVTTLSGGEGARTTFARTVSQTARLVLLDEPTAALDLRHQERLLGTAGALRDLGCCVVVVLHDLNLAARHADRVLVFDTGRLVADGAPVDVLTEHLVEDVYGQPVHVLRHPGTDLPLVVAAGGGRCEVGPAVRRATEGV